MSSGFYIGAHIAAAVASSAVSLPASVVQLSWQAYQLLEASSKHKQIIEELYERGLEPRVLTNQEKIKTAFYASLSVAVGEAIDALSAGTVINYTNNAENEVLFGHEVSCHLTAAVRKTILY